MSTPLGFHSKREILNIKIVKITQGLQSSGDNLATVKSENVLPAAARIDDAKFIQNLYVSKRCRYLHFRKSPLFGIHAATQAGRISSIVIC